METMNTEIEDLVARIATGMTTVQDALLVRALLERLAALEAQEVSDGGTD